jgi:hypothetical protein
MIDAKRTGGLPDTPDFARPYRRGIHFGQRGLTVKLSDISLVWHTLINK